MTGLSKEEEAEARAPAYSERGREVYFKSQFVLSIVFWAPLAQQAQHLSSAKIRRALLKRPALLSRAHFQQSILDPASVVLALTASSSYFRTFRSRTSLASQRSAA